jgi:excisionase family DNA binding protein
VPFIPWLKTRGFLALVCKRRPPVDNAKTILVTVDELATILSIGRTVAWELVRKRQIRSVKIGRTRRVPLTAIHAYVERLLDQEPA